MSDVLIRLEGVTKTYRRGNEELPVLQNLSLDVAEGAYEALMGPSGSGKTTLLNLIAGLDSTTRGRVSVGGADLGAMSDRERARWRSQNVGFIFQTYNLLPVLTAEENVALPLLLDGCPARAARERARAALTQVGLGHRARHRPDALSGGEMQRVAIARALIVNPALILADEPTGNLDTATGEQVLALLAEANRTRGCTVVLVTHEARAAACGRRIVTLRDGVVVGDGAAGVSAAALVV